MTFNLQNKDKTEIFRYYSFLWFCNLTSRYLLNEAFASKLPEEIFACFEVPNLYFKFGHLTREHPLYIYIYIYIYIYFFLSIKNFHLLFTNDKEYMAIHLYT